MTRQLINLCAVIFIVEICSAALASVVPTWQVMRIPGSDSSLSYLAVSPDELHALWLGTSQGLYRSSDQGESFQSILTLSTSSETISQISFDPGMPDVILALTESTLYYSADKGNHWEKIYSSQNETRRCLSAASLNGTIFLGTSDGIIFREKGNTVWLDMDGEIKNKAIYDLAGDEDKVFVTTAEKVYQVDYFSKETRELFSVSGYESEPSEIDSNEPLYESLRRIKDFKVILSPQPTFFIASDNGVYASHDSGNSWQRIAAEGLPYKEVNSILIVPKISACHGAGSANGGESGSSPSAQCVDAGTPLLFAATDQGVFMLQEQRWVPLYQGMEATEVLHLAGDSEKGLFAVTRNSLYRLTNFDLGGDKAEARQGHLLLAASNVLTAHGMPAIQLVQSWAIDYAEVNANKIRQWRKAASRKAVLPTVSFGLDRAATEKFHWDSGASPDNLIKGREYLDWDVSLSWDLGELMWNPDQTSIDSRSKMMVELREDILAQVTRLYFECRRVTLELAALADTTQPGSVEKQLRLEELTAMIDGFTDGKFSRYGTERGNGGD